MGTLKLALIVVSLTISTANRTRLSSTVARLHRTGSNIVHFDICTSKLANVIVGDSIFATDGVEEKRTVAKLRALAVVLLVDIIEAKEAFVGVLLLVDAADCF